MAISWLDAGAASLNALVCCDHADPALLGPFEGANDVTVNVKEYEGTGAGLAIVEQSRPGDWDVMVMTRSHVDARIGFDLRTVVFDSGPPKTQPRCASLSWIWGGELHPSCR